MEIVESDFKLILDGDRFDLYLLKVINAKNADKRREELVVAGYGMTLPTCLNLIINYRISRQKDVTTLKEYLELYGIEREKLTNLLQK